jgi:hypothetical protein
MIQTMSLEFQASPLSSLTNVDLYIYQWIIDISFFEEKPGWSTLRKIAFRWVWESNPLPSTKSTV